LTRSSSVFAGCTKSFRTKSETMVRVVATLMPPLEITHEVSSSGAERCYLNGMYVLATEAGEMHYPKDNNRRELELSMDFCQELWQAVKEDVTELGERDIPLSPGWWRQLNNAL